MNDLFVDFLRTFPKVYTRSNPLRDAAPLFRPYNHAVFLIRVYVCPILCKSIQCIINHQFESWLPAIHLITLLTIILLTLKPKPQHSDRLCAVGKVRAASTSSIAFTYTDLIVYITIWCLFTSNIFELVAFHPMSELINCSPIVS